MPAAKTKSTAGANGSAAPKAASRSGTATPVSTVGTKDAGEAAATLTGKPDKKAFEAEQDAIKAAIDAAQTKLNAVRDKIGLATGSGSSERRNELLNQLNEIKGHQSLNKSSRLKLREQIDAKQEALQQKIKALQNAKAKIPFKTVAEIDAHIKNLERQVESGNMKLADEKRALAEISTTKRSRRIVEGFQADQEAIDTDKREIEELKKQRDDPELKAINDKYDAIKAELDELRKQGDEAAAQRNKLYQERDALQAELKELYNRKRESFQRYKDHNDRYWAKVNEDRARRAERARAQKAAEELQKKKELAERLLEEAQVPAFQAHIDDCQTLIDFFSGKTTGAPTYKSLENQEKAELPGVKKLEIRKVEDIPEGSIVRKKKGEDEESYFVGGKGKSKGKKGGKTDSPATPTTASTSALNVPLPTLSALLSMSIPPPTSTADVPRVIEDLKTKKAWYEANQDRVTAENVAKAEKEIQRLTGETKPAAAAPAESSEPPSPSQDDAAPKEGEDAVEADS
ncbi:nuclear segregation protein Bfr1 [Coprinopsis cinerea okayama7|uniref:Nuclear segregation protein Bfr1 n=1 Tax=Coprinopsis cinerea (strain Okayama-7 / 130 / ATCC MYA-4618 / FGSC 9003) TaxID=240176 RepID=D6RMV9_COPC7|nr:nuclear segregation protein Bfr1 [Coprinopsis cinerea okayama7\|eukprot:XP_002911200.1 nuclear segregation protein Bfr1 [Coprinopsis cinerea okayama7\